MQWTHLFNRTILERGRQYYNTNRVSNYHKKNGAHCVSVRGTRQYQVTVRINEGEVNRMNCTCPHARDGFHCKHIAAALYYMEGEKLLEEETMLPISQMAELLNENPSPQYSYFNCAAMKQGFSLSASQLKQVSELIKSGKVKLEQVHVGYHGAAGYGIDDEVRGMATGVAMEKGQSHPITLWFTKNEIYQALCGVPGCMKSYQGHTRYGNKNLCLHQVALLALLEEYLKVYNPGDSTSRAAAELLAGFRDRRAGNVIANISAQEKPLNLTLKPRLQTWKTEWTLSFKIVGNKSFVVKDLSQLVRQVENKDIGEFGSNTEWPLGIENFSEQGKRYYEFIRQIVREEEERRRASYSAGNYYHDSRPVIEDSIPLFGRRLDEFFDVVGSEKIEWNQGYGKEKKTAQLSCREQKPEIHLTICKQEDDEKTFQGILVSGSAPELLYSPNAAYYLDDAYLNRVPKEVLQDMEPILNMCRGGEISFRIGRKHIGEFYYNVLPLLREYVHVTEKNQKEIMKYLPPEVAFVFYLDVEDEDITCYGEAVYGEWKTSLMDTARFMIAAAGQNAPVEEFRDLNRELETLMQLQVLFPYIDEQKDCFCCDGDEDLIYRILSGGIDELLKLGEVHATERLKRMNIRRSSNVSVGVSVESSIMNLSVSSDDISLQELLDILESYGRKKRFHRLKNGDFLDLESENETLEMLNQLMESMHIPLKEFVKGKMQIPVYRALYLDKMLEACDGAYVDRDRKFKALVKDFKTVEDADFDVPESLQKVLRKYQEVGYRWLRTLNAYGFGGILADDMGLGKTLQVITILLSERKSGPALIITPASLVYNWGEEFKRFAPELKVCLVAGTQVERRNKLKEWKSYDVLITSYDLIKRDITEYEDHQYSYEILDEAQYIKNHTTAAAKAVKVIKSRQRFALTGTPIENRLSELWSIFDYLMPGYLYSYEGFKRDFETPIVKHQDEDASRRLKQMVAPFILRRLKGQVLKDLPEKLEEIRYVKPKEEQQKLLDGQVAHMKMILGQTAEEEFSKNKMKILAELVRIRQICCDPALCFEDYHGGSAKREACLELIQSAIAGEHKMLVFSQFTSMLELLEKDLTESGISYYKITGATSKEERVCLVNMFNQDWTPVFLISLKAGGTGLNLTGADMVIHYDPWWNLAVQNQATDRAHRIGQTKVVTVYKMIVKDSIEERILHLQETKKELAEEILNGENGQLGSMSKEELMSLLAPEM